LADCKYLREIKFDGHFYDHVTTYHPGLSEYFAKKGISKSIVFRPHVRLHDRRVEVATVLAAALGMDARDNTGGIQLLAELKNPISGNYVRTNQDEVVWEYRHKETNRKLIVIDLDDDNEIRNYRLKWLAKNKKVEENTDQFVELVESYISSFYLEKLYRSNRFFNEKFIPVYTNTGLIREVVSELFFVDDTLIVH
jgi:hypothetical protein